MENKLYATLFLSNGNRLFFEGQEAKMIDNGIKNGNINRHTLFNGRDMDNTWTSVFFNQVTHIEWNELP